MNLTETEQLVLMKALMSCKTTIDSDSHRFYSSKVQQFDEELVRKALDILTKKG
jgi:hypothetical protein